MKYIIVEPMDVTRRRSELIALAEIELQTSEGYLISSEGLERVRQRLMD